jgi:hypothetical protein
MILIILYLIALIKSAFQVKDQMYTFMFVIAFSIFMIDIFLMGLLLKEGN